MAAVNKAVIIAAAGITAVGVVNAWANKKPITRVVLGGYMLTVFLAAADIFGGGVSTIAGAIAMLALVAAVLTEGLPIFDLANKAVAPPTQPGGGNGGQTKR